MSKTDKEGRREGEEEEGKRRRRREGEEEFKEYQRYGIISMEFVRNSKVLYGFPWNCRTSSLSPNLGFC